MPSHLYIHVPFCASKCAYCGFYSIPNRADLHAAYIAAVGRELRGKSRLLPQTIYFGGGTPGILGADGLRKLAGSAGVLAGVKEWTCELTPATATPDVLHALRDIGVTRISMGVQTFDPAVARRLGRHNADVATAVKHARDAGFDNIGLDLIAGLPGVTAARWRKDLDAALSLEPDHLSVYALTIEEGTPLAKNPQHLPSDATLLRRLNTAEEILNAAGFARYEISNYARPGKECRHHLGVWRGEDFLGIGPAAVSRVGKQRWRNAPDVESYIAREFPERESETLDDLSDACERTFTALRLLEGWDVSACVRRFPILATNESHFDETLRRLARHNFVEEFSNRWRLTRRGREVADAVVRELL